MKGEEKLQDDLPSDSTQESYGVCGGITVLLGWLGQRRHFCCRDCGAMFS
jgi:hypothetical protein